MFRHRLSTRLWHWVNVLVVFGLLMSGLMIFNAHPRLYWGEYGANPDPAILELGQFPGWATLPSTYDLAMGRRWHFFFAWAFVPMLCVYLLWSAVNGHLRKDLAPTRTEVSPGHLWAEVRRHARLRFPPRDAAPGYNALQKLAYLAVLFLLLPLIVLTGFTMSPGLDAAWPWLLDLFGGRQSARTIHFIAAFVFVLFVVVHLLMVLLAGPVNGIRSMITGRYRVPKEPTP